MALDKLTPKEEAPEGATVSSEDVEIATRMGIKLLMEGGGMDVIKKAIEESEDPTQVLGQFFAQMTAQLAEQLRDTMGIDPKVFLAKNGFLENMLNFVEGKLGLPPEFSEQVGPQVLEIIKAAAMNPDAKRGPRAVQGQPQPAGPAPMGPPGPGGPPVELMGGQ